MRKKTAWKIGEEEPVYKKRMWDTELCEWVPFTIWGAYFIVNNRKEYIVAQIWRPVDMQPEYGPTLKAWCSLDTSDLNDMLREKEDSRDKFNQMKSGIQAFKELIKVDQDEIIFREEDLQQMVAEEWTEMIRQDNEELKGEGAHDELPGYPRRRWV